MTKKLILFGITILTIILVIFIVPHILNDFCILDSQCTARFSHCSCSYYCSNIFYHPTMDCAQECISSLLNKTCFDNCYNFSGNQSECSEKCVISYNPKAPNCKCVNFHCKEE